MRNRVDLEAAIAVLRSSMVICIGTIFPSRIYDSINWATFEVGRDLSARRRSPADRCTKLRSVTSFVHWVPLPAPCS